MKKSSSPRLLIATAAIAVTAVGLFAASKLTNLHQQATYMTPDAGAETHPPNRAAAIEPVGAKKNGMLLVYPHDGSTINAPATYMTGTAAPGTALTVNGQPVRSNRHGYFAHVIPLVAGENHFSLVPNGDESRAFNFTIKKPLPTQPLPALPLQIMRSSLEPKLDMGLQPGDMLQFSMRGSPGSQATVTIGTKVIKLQQAGLKNSVNTGRDTAYGVAFQKSPPTVRDLYTGFYRVMPADTWQNETANYTLTAPDGTVLEEKAKGLITVLPQPFVATTTHDDTVVRVGPGAGRTTPFAEGVRVLVDGYRGDSYRCEMISGKHLWIEKSDLATAPETPGVPPVATVRTINIENEGTNGGRIVIPLDQRLPYEVKQEITPTNKLVLKIFGATADTDWITEPSTSAKAVSTTANAAAAAAKHPSTSPKGRAYPPSHEHHPNPVSFVTWQQIADHLYQVTVNLNEHQQWGYWVDYDDTNLVLHIKGKPNVNLSDNSLAGLKICVDPGHGGAESGAIGCSGTREATINFAIAKRVEQLLQARGAEVIMTRDGDVDVSLADRVATAVLNKADLLVSIHGNSLPDGLNPWTEYGTSSYYYHPQSLQLASHIRQGVVNHLGFNDYHTRWQNLFVCRPSQMPAQLVEIGFINNPDELSEMLSPAGQEKAAIGIVNGVHQFLSHAFNPTVPKPAQHPAKKANHPVSSTRGH